MNLFSSGPIEAANQDANARMNPVRQQDLEAGLFSGIPTAAGQAIGGVINRPAMIAADTLTPMLTPMAKSLDRVFKSDLNGYLLREQEKTHQAARDLTPDPAVVGWVGQNLIYGGASILGDVAVGTLATGNPFAGLAYAAGAQGYQAYGSAKDSGLNTQTALGMAGITGASTFLGGFVPVWLGQGVATNLMGRAMLAEVSGKAATASGLYGAASLAAVASTNTAAKLGTAGLLQTATGIPTRASISALLEANGYPDMAKQYHAFSLSEMVSDFAIGSIFGLGVHGYQKAFVDRVPPAKPSDLNAALALNNASHVELGTAPGIPVTPEARAAHVEAVNKAISDLLGDRPVEVGDSVTKADFIENPSAAETRAQIVRVVEQHMGPEWEGLQAQLRERGLPENTELYDIQPGPSPVRVTDNVRSMIAEFEKTGDTGALLERLRTLGGKLEQRVEANAAKGEGDLTRGNLWIRERLIRAERNGEITPEAHTLVKWLLDNNPAIADELAISFRKGGDGVNGTYNPFQKLVTLFKGRGNDLTAAHEVLHHTERMMPEAVRDGIREEWINQLHALQKWASENQVHDLMRAIDDVIRATAGDEAAAKRVNDLIKDGTLPYEFYQYVNPSEFWAVNAARLVADRAGAKGWVAKAVQWLKEFIEKAKSAFGLNSDAAIIRGLDAVLKSDGKISGNMLLQGGMSFNDMARGKAGDGPIAASHETPQDRENSLSGERISPRMPTAVKAAEDHMGEIRLQPDLATAMRDPAAFAFNMELMSQYPNFLGLRGTPQQRVEAIIQHAVDNLLWLHDNWKPEYRDRSKMWYVGGNRIAHRWAERFNVAAEKVAGVIAATSPQKDWFQNVSLAERIMEAVINRSQDAWDSKMTSLVRSRDWGPKAVPDPSVFEGKTLRDMFGSGSPQDLLNMAIWIRAWDEANNPMMARVITPEGGFAKGWDVGKTGKPVGLRWQSFPTIVKTLQILMASDRSIMSSIIGANHKVRSFFNNIIAPYAGDDVTIDTHAVAAALLRPLGSSSVEVAHNFGAGELGSPGPKNSAVTGLYGTYPIYAEAYRRAASQVGILPREMQSITWEAVRGLFRPEQKNERIKAESDRIWQSVARGELNAETARERISALVGGIQDPAWVRSPAGQDEARSDSSYARELPEAGIPGRGAGSDAGRSGMGDAGAVQPGETAGRENGSPESVILSERPDLVVPSDNGEPMLARDILAQSDAEIAQAKQDSQGYDAAVACALRG